MVNALLNERVLIESRRQVMLETCLMTLKEGEHKLFLAAEQGVGKYDNNVTVILNSKMIKKAKYWLVNDYPKLKFAETKERKSSVNEQQYKDNTKYNDELIEFLRPTLESKEAVNNKIYGKSMKTYAQALGINQHSKLNDQAEKRSKENNMKMQ